MRRIRVIPVLLIQNDGLVKSIKFKNHKYLGDPINAVRIFNEKEVDELAILDISASKERRAPNFEQIAEIASEAFMPLSYGGGITSLAQVETLFFNGIEKVTLNTSALNNIGLITEIAKRYGNQAVTVSVDVKKDWLGRYRIYKNNGSDNTGLSPEAFAKQVENAGAGEIFLNSIDRDGTFEGFDMTLINLVASHVDIPVIACGGANVVEDFAKAVQTGASAVAAGSMFVFQKPHRAVLISYPNQTELTEKLFKLI
jgi:imidazole glycerol-phosphate synthase subunit HisF